MARRLHDHGSVTSPSVARPVAPCSAHDETEVRRGGAGRVRAGPRRLSPWRPGSWHAMTRRPSRSAPSDYYRIDGELTCDTEVREVPVLPLDAEPVAMLVCADPESSTPWVAPAELVEGDLSELVDRLAGLKPAPDEDIACTMQGGPAYDLVLRFSGDARGDRSTATPAPAASSPQQPGGGSERRRLLDTALASGRTTARGRYATGLGVDDRGPVLRPRSSPSRVPPSPSPATRPTSCGWCRAGSPNAR